MWGKKSILMFTWYDSVKQSRVGSRTRGWAKHGKQMEIKTDFCGGRGARRRGAGAGQRAGRWEMLLNLAVHTEDSRFFIHSKGETLKGFNLDHAVFSPPRLNCT